MFSSNFFNNDDNNNNGDKPPESTGEQTLIDQADPVDWKKRIVDTYDIPKAIFQNAVWDKYTVDFQALFLRLAVTNLLVNKGGRKQWPLWAFLTLAGIKLPWVFPFSLKTNETIRPIHFAAWSGNLELVKFLCGQQEGALGLKTKYGLLPIHYAAKSGNLELVKWLHGKQENALGLKNNDGWLPIHFAAWSGNLELVKFLISAKEREDALGLKANDGLLPIHCAARSGHLELVKFLCKQQKDALGLKDNDGWRPIHFAALSGNLELVKWLHGKQENALGLKTNDGLLPIHCAAKGGNLELVKSLITEYGCDPFATSNGRLKSLADFARESGNKPCIEFCSDTQGLKKMRCEYLLKLFLDGSEQELGKLLNEAVTLKTHLHALIMKNSRDNNSTQALELLQTVIDEKTPLGGFYKKNLDGNPLTNLFKIGTSLSQIKTRILETNEPKPPPSNEGNQLIFNHESNDVGL